MATIDPQRILTLPHALNLRELGGYSTADGRTLRWQRLLRSGSLAHLEPAGAQALADYGVRLVIDLRTDREVQRAPDQLAPGVRYQQLSVYPFADQPSWWTRQKAKWQHVDLDSMTHTYARMLTDSHARQVFRALIDALLTAPADAATLIHCTAGKDRTGVAVMMLLGMLGVDPATIRADYLLTNDAFAGAAASGSRRVDAMNAVPAAPRYVDAVFTTLAQQYGDWPQYAQTALGLGAADLAALQARFLA